MSKEEVILGITKNLKDTLGNEGLLDIGLGVEKQLGVSKANFKAALAILREEGYGVYKVELKLVGTEARAYLKVLAPPGTSYAEVFKQRTAIRRIKVPDERL